MKNHKLMPQWLRGFFNYTNFTAITVSKNTAWYLNYTALENEKTRRHEEVHMEQYERHGWLIFVILYIWYSIIYGYWNNPFEIEARERS